ncbi:hypothetical protein AaE_011218 [Aphanomyces astaci]|uniref:Lipoyl-binding domain-containing protein n=1 Tax=Aphanomyces astaci TaxID=112090 RepID=A0A6A4ZRW1_APHAT|nr:hypothetical protein AaE_011218 [Aphanomyces astaci]
MMFRSIRAAASMTTRRASYMSVRSFSLPSHEVVGLPALSPTMEQGNLSKWLLKEGDAISAGDIICQIETDKAVVDYEAQDDMFLARILVAEGAEGIVVGQPIMVTVDSEADIAAFKDFQPEVAAAAPVAPKSPEEIPPQKHEVKLDPATHAPVVPSDFLVTPQVPHKIVPGPAIPAPVVAKAAPVAPAPPAATAPLASFNKWGLGVNKSAISHSLAQRQKAYLALYGPTGTFPISKA